MPNKSNSSNQQYKSVGSSPTKQASKSIGDIRPSSSMKKILFVVNDSEFFCSHRLPIAIKAKAEGFDVYVASSRGLGVDEIINAGLNHQVIAFSRSGQNPIQELITLWQLFLLFLRIKPDLVHLITIKPILYGGIVARLTRVQSVVAAVSGLGTVFISRSTVSNIRLWLVKILYKIAFGHQNLVVVFQNQSDRDTFIKAKIIKNRQTNIIRGSGVNLAEYSYSPEPKGVPVVAMAARLLRDKGVFEFVEAAKILKKRRISVIMQLIGSPDLGNPTSITELELITWKNEGNIEFLGYRSDISNLYSKANIVCLPSYREGLPKSLVEAAACGRVVITTDVPGCRDAITEGVTGVLVPVKNAVALAETIEKLVNDDELRRTMGLAGRKLAEEAFDIDIIVRQHLDIYELLSNG